MENLSFHPSPLKNTYIAVNYHQRTAGYREGKHRWAIKAYEQFELFCAADNTEHRWISDGKLYSFRNKMDDIIGMEGERIGEFVGSDKLKEWHGYPKKKCIISSDLIDHWLEKGLISVYTKKHLIKKEI